MFQDIYKFLEKLFSDLESIRVDISKLHLDHVCYRVASVKRYEEVKSDLLKINKLLIESMVGSRMIATFKLTHPIFFRGRFIDCLELPSPKKGSNYDEGFEHAEFVIEESFEQFMQKYDFLTFHKKGLAKEFNPELRIKLNEGRSVKFHHLTLEKVIEIEKEQLKNK